MPYNDTASLLYTFVNNNDNEQYFKLLSRFLIVLQISIRYVDR